MPILINELIADVPDTTVPAQLAKPPEDRMPVTEQEHKLIAMLALLEERKQRLEFD